jgi:hypothetical protein
MACSFFTMRRTGVLHKTVSVLLAAHFVQRREYANHNRRPGIRLQIILEL